LARPHLRWLSQTNQTKHCWANYVEFHKCEILKGKDDKACRRFDQTYRSLCPEEWVEEWEQQRASLTFPGQEIWVSVRFFYAS